MTAHVVTGEAVALDVRLARWPSRTIALAIDLTAQLVCWFFGLLVLSRILTDIDFDLVYAVVYGALALVLFGYPIAMETFWHGRSLGKAALGLRVVRDDGSPERFRHSVARALLMPFELAGPALVTSIFSKRSKRLGDLLGGTIVVQERIPGGPSRPIAMPPPLVAWAGALDLSQLSDELAMSCRQFLARQSQLKPGPRDAMGRQLVAEVQAVVTLPAPPGTPGWAYLAAILAERRRREEWRLRAAAQRHAAYGQPAYRQPAYGQTAIVPQRTSETAAPPSAPPPSAPETSPPPFAPPE